MKPIIQESHKLNQFKLLDSNRPVQPKHVQQLKKAIQKKNLLHLNPIIVDAKMNVIDGQHRLQAARELSLPIYFMVDDSISDRDVADLNTNKSNWSTFNYIDYYVKKGNPNYKKLSQYIKSHPELQFSAAINFLMKDANINGMNRMDLLRNGKYTFDNQAALDRLIELASDFADFRHRYEREFLRALQHLVNTGVYDHKIMMEKYQGTPGFITRQPSLKEYVDQMEKLYNKGRSLNFVNLKLSGEQREKIAAKERVKIEREAKAKIRKRNTAAPTEKKFAEDFLKNHNATIKPDTAGKSIKVQLDPKTIIWVKPGTDIKALKKKYEKHKLTLQEDAA